MSAPVRLEADQALADLDELIRLSERARWFDLFEFLRLLSEEGLGARVCKVNDGSAPRANGLAFRHEIAERLKGILSALRAWERYLDKIECAANDHCFASLEITPEMIEAAENFISEEWGGRSPRYENLLPDFVSGLFRIMAAASPYGKRSREYRISDA